MKNGGPAFPHTGYSTYDPETGITTVPLGMSLRDYFAAAALIGKVMNSSVVWSYEDMAEFAFKTADAMLAEREKEAGV